MPAATDGGEQHRSGVGERDVREAAHGSAPLCRAGDDRTADLRPLSDLSLAQYCSVERSSRAFYGFLSASMAPADLG